MPLDKSMKSPKMRQVDHENWDPFSDKIQHKEDDCIVCFRIYVNWIEVYAEVPWSSDREGQWEYE